MKATIIRLSEKNCKHIRKVKSMKKNFSNTTCGFTLIELIITVSILSIIIALSTNLIIYAVKTQKITLNEYNLQSAIRNATEKTNTTIRYSKAVFAVPETYVESLAVMDPSWNYIMVSKDKKRIVIMEYSEESKKHEEKVIVNESDNIIYETLFAKDTDATTDSVMNYKIYAYLIDSEGNRISEKLLNESTVEAINAIQVADKGTRTSPSIALAYRTDGQTSGKGKNQIAYITIILDISNSMNQTPAGSGSSTSETSNSRIRHVRKALVGDGTSSGSGIIQQFSNEENVFISIVPFANTANYPVPHVNMNPDYLHPIYEAYKNSDKNSLISTINNLKADGHDSRKYGQSGGGTNTGDGLRQSYYLHNGFRSRMSVNDKDQVHHYMILLVDGESTFESKLRNWVDNGNYETRYIYDSRGRRTGSYELWIPKGKNTDSYFIDSGNINVNRENNPVSPYRTEDIRNPQNGRRYGSKNGPVEYLAITGTGSDYVGNRYIDAIGSLVENFDEGNGVKSYIIAYAKNLGTQINSIGTSIGTDSEHIYKYDDPGFNLDEIFKNIATDIMADFWLVSGPQIITHND